jgi:hypothetical protein
MGAPLTALRATVRRDLHDESASRWTDAVLDRHILRAVAEYQQVWPLEATTDLTLSEGVRVYDLSGLSGLLWVERVWYPYAADEPPGWSPFVVAGSSLYLLGAAAPRAGDVARVWYAKAHTLDTATSTIPDGHDHVIALGAVAFAHLEYASYALARVNASERAPEGYRAYAQARYAEFRARLEALALERAARTDGRVAWPLRGEGGRAL